MSASTAKVRANRRNARKSTGPTSDEGKIRASLNAVSHGLYCRHLILPGESLAEFLSLRVEYHSELRATDPVEFGLVERIVMLQWKLRRVQLAENTSTQLITFKLKRIAERKIEKIEKSREKYYISDEGELREFDEDLEAKKKVWRDELEILDYKSAIADDFSQNTPRLDRIARYEQRLSQLLYRAMRELQTYRKTKPKGEQAMPPYASLEAMNLEFIDEAAKETGIDVRTVDWDEDSAAGDDDDRDATSDADAGASDAPPTEQNGANSAQSVASEAAAERCDELTQQIVAEVRALQAQESLEAPQGSAKPLGRDAQTTDEGTRRPESDAKSTE